MDSARWEKIQAIFLGTVELPQSERAAFLASACGEDSALFAEVARMLQADIQDTSILAGGLPEIAYRTVGGSSHSVSFRSVGPYRLKSILGEGGMGVVWLAAREDTGHLVAIKFLPHAGLSPARRERFAREIKTLAKLNHPYIARLYDAGALPDGTPWFVMEYVEGLPFAEYCRTCEHALDRLLRLFRMICEAVQYAHGQEIIHRDLKPSNILVQPDGTPRLLDFGIARELQSLDEPGEQTRAGLRFLSPDYAAPEWVRDGSVGFYTDVYSLGVILYELLSGRLPAVSADSEHPENPSLAGRQRFPQTSASAWADLDVLCLKALHADARERYPSVEALIRDVDHYLRGQPLDARPDTLPYRLGKFVRRHRKTVVSSAAAGLLLIALIGFFTFRLAAERDHANRETAIATATNQFLSDDLLGRSDPFQSGKAQEPFVDVVARASSQIDAKLAGEPIVAGRLHHTLANAFDNRSDYPRARQEYEKAHDLFLRGEGALSESAVLVRLDRAVMEAKSYESGSLATAKSLLADAENSISRSLHPSASLKVSDLAARGAIALRSNDPKPASELLAAALQQSLEIPSFDERQRIAMKRWLVSSYIHLNDGAKAEPLARDLVADLDRTQGPESPSSLWARAYLAQTLLIQRKFAAAVAEVNRIYPLLVKILGEDHQVTLTALGTRAAAEGSLMMSAESIRDDLAIYQLAKRKNGPSSMYTVGMLSDAGLSQCRAGQQRAGEANTRAAYVDSKRAFGAAAPLTAGTAYALAVCLIGRNALNEASALLENIDVQAITQLGGNSSAAADIALSRGEIALRRGDYASARHYLDLAAPVLDRPDADVSQRQSVQKLRQALDTR